MSSRYRWVILGVGAAGAGAFSALRMGLPALGPALRDAYGLSLPQVGFAFTAVAIGVMLTLVPWGVLTDRIGERPVMGAGLAGTAVALVATAYAPGYGALLLGLLVAGMLGSSSTGASGRAVMGWFARDERGFALGIRQMALPLGGAAASIALPQLVDAGGLRGRVPHARRAVPHRGDRRRRLHARRAAARPPAADGPRSAAHARPRGCGASAPPARCSSRRRRRCSASSCCSCTTRAACRRRCAAAGLAVVQLIGAGMRIVAGRRSDREGLRIAPIRRIATRNFALLGVTGALVTRPASCSTRRSCARPSRR